MSARPVTFGVISDTHCPKRLARLPDAIFTALDGVDLILHAGDVGELWVLDALSRLAPVVAVHGNDETPDAVAALPYRQVVTIAGQRILLMHGHFTDPAQEAAQRADDRWSSSFARWTSIAHEHGASIVVYGHSHIPTAAQQDGVWLINGGAIAPANVFSKQTTQSVARVTLQPGQPPSVVHIDLAHLDTPHVLPDDFESGFADFYRRYTSTILAPDLADQGVWLRNTLLDVADAERIIDALLPLAHECWSGQRDSITVRDAVAAWRAEPTLPHVLYDRIRENPVFSQYL